MNIFNTIIGGKNNIIQINESEKLDLNQAWFEKKFDIVFEKVKDKYDNELHTIDKNTESAIYRLLQDEKYQKYRRKVKNDLENCKSEILRKIFEFIQKGKMNKQEATFLTNFANSHLEKLLELPIAKINHNDLEACKKVVKDISKQRKEFKDELDNKISNNKYIQEIAFGGFIRADIMWSAIFEEEDKKFINFFANAAEGKTHLSCDICFTKIKNDKLPAILLLGSHFNDETDIKSAVLKKLDIPHSYTFENFLDALNDYGKSIKTVVPIVIDGLNETTRNKYFSTIWKDELPSFVKEISSYSNIVLITTCRTSYKDAVNINRNFEEHLPQLPFSKMKEAMEKYFKKYKINANIYFGNVNTFSSLIFLKLFCEVKNPNWKSSRFVDVDISANSHHIIFHTYFKQINAKILGESSLFKGNENFVVSSLLKIADYLWVNNTREIPIDDFYGLFGENENYDKDKSKADLLIHEGLLITRDIRDVKEFISFTYEIMSGYLIALNLVNNQELSYFQNNADFTKKITGKHPLWEDTISFICILLPQIKGKYLYEIVEANNSKYSKLAIEYSFYALFQLENEFLPFNIKQVIESLFDNSDNNKKIFFEKIKENNLKNFNQLNFCFASKLLEKLSVKTRDLTWTEDIRSNTNFYEEYLIDFEKECRSEKLLVPEVILHDTAELAKWVLTSTDRSLRDLATRALYFYGIKFPNEFSHLIINSLKINDPYVWERTLAAFYGVFLKRNKEVDFSSTIKQLYNLMFAENAPYYTTHILARDYAKKVIQITLKLDATILCLDEQKIFQKPVEIRFQFKQLSKKRTDWGGLEQPIKMDFSNYTIGQIVTNGRSYDDPPEKQEVRNQIYWRINNLGWNLKEYSEVERSIVHYGDYSRSRQKVERYGKKYAWIGFYENAGYREDKGLLATDNYWTKSRFIDIDPTFPEYGNSIAFELPDLLGNKKLSLQEWYLNGGIPDLRQFLINDNYNNSKWVCLYGSIQQDDKDFCRNVFGYIRSFLVKETEYDSVVELLKKEQKAPSPKEDYYTFGAEIYNKEAITEPNILELTFVVGKEKMQYTKEEAESLSNRYRLPKIVFTSNPKYLKQSEEPIVDCDDIEEDDFEFESSFLDFEETKSIKEGDEYEVNIEKTFEVLSPVQNYRWEEHHSTSNSVHNQTVISKELAIYLNLRQITQSFNLYDENNEQASFSLKAGDNYRNSHELTYFRKDLLDKYLEENKYKLVYVIWGEREISYDMKEGDRNDFFENLNNQDIQVYQEIVKYPFEVEKMSFFSKIKALLQIT